MVFLIFVVLAEVGFGPGLHKQNVTTHLFIPRVGIQGLKRYALI
jgi:hypothetical protein